VVIHSDWSETCSEKKETKLEVRKGVSCKQVRFCPGGFKRTEYPAEKMDLVEHARLHGAGKDVLDDIKNLPDIVYTSASDVNRELDYK
jgi:Protein of unknown function (DUF2795)